MRILIYALNFSPEPIGCGRYTGEMAFWLASRGHEVRVLTTPAHYPFWKLPPGAPRWFCAEESMGSVQVWRVPVWVPEKPAALKRLLYLGGFALRSLPALLRHLSWRPDVVWTVEPALMGAPGALAFARLCGAKTWLHVQDFEVDAAFGLGLLKSGRMRAMALASERSLLKRFHRVSTISERMREHLSKKGVPLSRTVCFPNWVDTEKIYPLDRPSLLRPDLNLSQRQIVALYAGNMAAKQGLEILIEAAGRLQDEKDIVFVLAGEGPARPELERKSGKLKNVLWLALQSEGRLNELLNLADIHLLPQKDGVADLVLPSKLGGMLASGRPVIATSASGSQLHAIVSQCGASVAPGSADSLVQAVRGLALDKGRREVLGKAARVWAERYLAKPAILSGFEEALLDLVTNGRVGLGPRASRERSNLIKLKAAHGTDTSLASS